SDHSITCGEVLEAIRAVLAACPFHGEGYRKVRARLAHRGLQLGGKRVLRLMRAAHRAPLARRLCGIGEKETTFVSGIRSRRHTGSIWATPSGSRWATVDRLGRRYRPGCVFDDDNDQQPDDPANAKLLTARASHVSVWRAL